MFAIVRTGNKQFKVEANNLILVEKLEGNVGDEIQLNDVLMIGQGDQTTIGTPTVDGAVVTARIEAQQRADKVIVFKKKRRKNYRRKNGHRQHETALRIISVSANGKSDSAAVPAAKKPKAEKALVNDEGTTPESAVKASKKTKKVEIEK